VSVHDRSGHHDEPQRSFLTSPPGLTVLGFFIIAGAYIDSLFGGAPKWSYRNG
jgi:hypothetical protein